MRNAVAMLTASTLVAAVGATPTTAYSQVIIVLGTGYQQPYYTQPQPYPYLPPTPYQQPAPVIYNYAAGYSYPGAYTGYYNGYNNGYYRPYWGW